MGNFRKNGQRWPVMQRRRDGKRCIIIPYSLEEPTAEELEIHKAFQDLQDAGKINKAEISQELQRSVELSQVITTAVNAWNATDLVHFMTMEEYEHHFKKPATNSIKFETSNKEQECRSPCIGMCPVDGVHIVTCDIAREGRFHSDALESMMHELGHVIGLRHEFARADRDKYVDTNFPEKFDGECVPFGKYDLRSIMHYGLGCYDGGKYLFLAKKFEDTVKLLYPDDAEQWLEELKAAVGKTPELSLGDLDTVQEIIDITVQEQKEAKEAAAAAAAAAAATAAATEQFNRMMLLERPHSRASRPASAHSSELPRRLPSWSHEGSPVSSILGKFGDGAHTHYLVQWVSGRESTWVLASALVHARGAIAEFEDQNSV